MANLSGFIQVPIDAGGKRVRTVVQTIGTSDVHSEYQVSLQHDRMINTIYNYCSGALVVGATADAANVGRVYVHNDPDSLVSICISKVGFKSQLGSALVTATSPVFSLRRFTFIGNTPSGAALTAVKLDPNLPTKDTNWNVRTASTGMTITEIGDCAQFMPVVCVTAVGASPPSDSWWVPGNDRPCILRPGDGIMLKQIDAGTASDTRRVTVEFEIEEYVAVTLT